MMAEEKTTKARKSTTGKKKAPVAEKANAGGKSTAPAGSGSRPRLQELYVSDLAPRLQKELGLSSIMAVPRLSKITLNMGVGEAVADRKVIENALEDMTKIAGQRPVITRARVAIANFKVRAGFPVGCKVTLRGRRMYEFLDRLISVAIPRIRDFRGISPRQFDGRGNFSMGITEQIVFPEIEYDKVDKLRGLNIVINTTALKDEHARVLLSGFSFPFRKA